MPGRCAAGLRTRRATGSPTDPPGGGCSRPTARPCTVNHDLPSNGLAPGRRPRHPHPAGGGRPRRPLHPGGRPADRRLCRPRRTGRPLLHRLRPSDPGGLRAGRGLVRRLPSTQRKPRAPDTRLPRNLRPGRGPRLRPPLLPGPMPGPAGGKQGPGNLSGKDARNLFSSGAFRTPGDVPRRRRRVQPRARCGLRHGLRGVSGPGGLAGPRRSPPGGRPSGREPRRSPRPQGRVRQLAGG